MNTPVGRLGAAVEAAKSGVTEEQKRRHLGRAERLGWFPAWHGTGSFGILSPQGHEVARCGKESDRDAILATIRSETKMVILVERLLAEIKTPGASARAIR